jgi:hypothetical protein
MVSCVHQSKAEQAPARSMVSLHNAVSESCLLPLSERDGHARTIAPQVL